MAKTRKTANLEASDRGEARLRTRRRQTVGDSGSAVAPSGGAVFEDLVALQRLAGNRATRSIIQDAQTGLRGPILGPHALLPAVQGAPPIGVAQRALAPDKISEPAYSDGLDLNTILTTALDKPPRPKMSGSDWSGKANKGARKVLRALFGDDQTDWDLSSDLLLQVGEIHGNQEYKNKSGDLPDDSFLEYDVAKYAGDPKARGDKRVVTGTKDGKKRYYYTSNHYTDFAEFIPGT